MIDDDIILRTAGDPQRVTLLDEAIRLTMGDRNASYGDPVTNHEHIAMVASAITGREFSARDIVMVHIATKLARLAKNPTHRDSHVDLMAYAGIAFECALSVSEDREGQEAGE